MANEIGELVVTAPSGWADYTGGYVNFVAQYSAGQLAVTAAEANAIQQTEAQVHLAPGASLADPRTKQMYEEIKEHVASVRYIAEYWTTFDPFRKIAFLPDGTGLTGSQVDAMLDKVRFEVTNAFVTNGAETIPDTWFAPANTPFTIKINPNDSNTINAVTHPNLGYKYLIGHEIGHASAQYLDFVIKNASALGPAAPNTGLMESAASTFGRALSPSGTFPTNADLIQANQPQMLPPPAPSNAFATAGNDTIQGVAYDTMILGGDGVDTITYASHSPITIDLRPPAVITPTGTLILGIENVTGSPGDDVITGDVKANTIFGLTGADLLSGFDGNDYVHGNQGADNLNGNRGNDTVVGGMDNDFVLGGQGDDMLFGDAGADQLYGDAGNDTLSGGVGADRFFVHNQAGADRITDFNRPEGDQVVVQSGSYSVYQSGADVVVDFLNGSNLTIVNTSLATLAPGWIV